MKLILKFNLVFAVMFAIGLGITGYVAHKLLYENARQEVLQNARIMMEAALAARGYTSKQIRPLLASRMETEFLPQSVPAYGATEQFNELRTNHPEYGYKEATLNPTNPRDRAADWEADIIQRFRQTSDSSELIGERDTPSGPSLYLARPIQIKDAGCLVCHSTVDAAPRSLIKRYGEANGFGWQFNEVVGAQVVSVPMTLPIQKANNAFRTFMLAMGAVLAVIFIGLNLMITFMVVRPVMQLAKLADEVSMGKLDAADFTGGSDEIGVLGLSFNRMKKSLVEAMKLLD
ncbi:MAG: DUF3365 domain-containing protein [Rhodocyclaceae bacterium]|nr:DUF3365 domain-containing protein [Rhodocyclaceae bacterium]MBX3669974.1 DUF3365 domain-containing protein [Rhodocyclaceae bacterium]